MRKIPTVFLRDFAGDPRYVTREPNPECAWVFAGEGEATRKYDGTCVALLYTDGEQVSKFPPVGGPSVETVAPRWFARREVKTGKTAPPNFVPVENDPATGKTVGWEPIEQSAFAKFHAEAIRQQDPRNPFEPGTYELCGAKVNGNPESFVGHVLVRHATATELVDVPRDFDGLAECLSDFPHEGIVWHHEDGRMAKLKVRDFPRDRKAEVA